MWISIRINYTVQCRTEYSWRADINFSDYVDLIVSVRMTTEIVHRGLYFFFGKLSSGIFWKVFCWCVYIECGMPHTHTQNTTLIHFSLTHLYDMIYALGWLVPSPGLLPSLGCHHGWMGWRDTWSLWLKEFTPVMHVLCGDGVSVCTLWPSSQGFTSTRPTTHSPPPPLHLSLSRM